MAGMQDNRRVLTIFLSAGLFLLLGVTAYFQLSWAVDLQQLEQQRLQSALAKNIVKLTTGIHQELYLLPTLAMTNDIKRADIERNVTAAVRFWETHAAERNLFSGIYLFEPTIRERFLEWEHGNFTVVKASDHELLEYYTSVFLDRRRDENSSLLISLPDDKILFMNQITGAAAQARTFLICIVDYTMLTESLVPKLIHSAFDDSDMYNYRLFNPRTGKTLHLSEGAESRAFALPDFTLPLLPFSNIGYNINLKPFSMDKLPMTPDFYNFIKNRLHIFSETFPQEFSIYDLTKNILINPWSNGGGPRSDSLILEFVHKQGSLFRASLNATAQNIITSLLVLIILGVGMLILVINTQKAQRLARRQQEFISTITHELKTPLAVISSAAQNLSDGIINNPEKIRRYGQIIQKEDVRLHSSIEYFLLYSHLNTSAKFTRKETSLAALIETTLTRTEQLLAENGFTVEKNLAGSRIFVYCDTTAILSVLQNLITNAVKHAAAGRFLGISLSKEAYPLKVGGRKCRDKSAKFAAVVRVWDHGRGIPKNEQKSVFEAFSRGRDAVNMQIEGSGIGLNLAKRIITMHGGTISIESSTAQGTVFMITLPCVEEEKESAT